MIHEFAGRSVRSTVPLLALAPCLLLALLASGCQSYQPLPLDPAAHEAEWRQRSPNDERLVEYAAKLRMAHPDRARTWNPADGISLGEAEVVTLFFNPELRQLRVEALVPLAAAEHAANWEDPEFGVDGEVILEDIKSPFVVGGLFSLTIPLSGRPGNEKRLELAKHNAATWQVRVAEATVLARLRQAWLAWSGIRDRIALIDRYDDEVRTVHAIATRLAEAGESSRAEVRVFDIEQLELRGQRQQLEATARELELQLRELMGLMPDAPLDLQPTTNLRLPELVAEERRERLRATADMLLRTADHEVSEREVRLEISKQYPDLTFGVGYANEEGSSRIAFGLGLPIPSFNLNRRGIAESRAHRVVSKVAWEAAYEALVHQLAQAEARLAAVRERLTFLTDEMAPLIDTQVEDLESLAELGEFDALLQLEALRRRHEAREELLAAHIDETRIRIRIHRLCGRTFRADTAGEETDQ